MMVFGESFTVSMPEEKKKDEGFRGEKKKGRFIRKLKSGFLSVILFLKKNFVSIVILIVLLGAFFGAWIIFDRVKDGFSEVFKINEEVSEQWKAVEERIAEIEAKLPVLKKELSILEKQVQQYENVKDEGLKLIQSEKLKNAMAGLNEELDKVVVNLERFRREK